MTHDQLLYAVLDRGLFAILRLPDSSRVLDLVAAIRAGGITTVEITLTTPGALKLIPKIREALGPGGIIGAGTVLDGATARAAIDAGAEFLVSPITTMEVIQTARRHGVLSMPGAFTPTEIMAAWEAGADVIKVFPAEVLGPGFFRAFRRPLPQVRIAPTGGIDLMIAAEFLEAGACCIGIGGPLSDAAGNLDQIRDLAKQYGELVRAHRAGK